MQDAFVIAVEQQARERLERLSALRKIKPVDMTALSQQVFFTLDLSLTILTDPVQCDPSNWHLPHSNFLALYFNFLIYSSAIQIKLTRGLKIRILLNLRLRRLKKSRPGRSLNQTAANPFTAPPCHKLDQVQIYRKVERLLRNPYHDEAEIETKLEIIKCLEFQKPLRQCNKLITKLA